MSTSLLYHAFGIRGYHSTRTDSQDGADGPHPEGPRVPAPDQVAGGLISITRSSKITSLTKKTVLSMNSKARWQREREEMRAKILDAARALFVTQGVEAVTMRKIAEK